MGKKTIRTAVAAVVMMATMAATVNETQSIQLPRQRQSAPAFELRREAGLIWRCMIWLFWQIVVQEGIETAEKRMRRWIEEWFNDPVERAEAERALQRILVGQLSNPSLSEGDRVFLLRRIVELEKSIGEVERLRHNDQPPPQGHKQSNRIDARGILFRADPQRLNGRFLALTRTPGPSGQILVRIEPGAEGIMWSGNLDDRGFYRRSDGMQDLYLKVVYRNKSGYVPVYFLEKTERWIYAGPR